jgi:hypothetical protein
MAEPAPRKTILTATSQKSSFLGSYSVSVFLTTLLFLVIFIAGSAWTMAVNKQFEQKPGVPTQKYWEFAIIMTLGTVLMAIGFGALAEFLKGLNINVNITSLLGADID